MKTVDTLVDDINEVIQGNGGWDNNVTEFLSKSIADVCDKRFGPHQEEREAVISPSMIGTQCDREIWYKTNLRGEGEPLSPEALGTFFYGDILEQIVISLAIAAGHKVECIQEPIEIYGMKGTSDVVIDGMVVDVKSASNYGFEKFKNGWLKGYTKNTRSGEVKVPREEADSFGYLSQLSSYLAAYQDDDRVTYKDKAAFLAVRKERFQLALDVYDLTEELAGKKEEIERARAISEGELPQQRLPAVPHGKENYKLGTKCSYCAFKQLCWPGLRTFIYSSGPVFMTHVGKEPDVPEVYV